MFQLQAANPEALPEGLSLGEGTLRDVIELRNPITGKLEVSSSKHLENLILRLTKFRMQPVYC